MTARNAQVIRILALSFALVLSGALTPAGAPAESSPGEYEVKGAFLLNFARLVEWPGDAFADPRAPLTVALLSAPDSMQSLEKILDGKPVGSRKVKTQWIATPADASGFHMVFVDSSSGAEVGEVTSAVGGAPVLLVGESKGFATNGGAINFFSENNKIRFEVNPRAAEAAGLRVSSRLLRVAKIVGQ